MKKVILPTDFSANAENAMRYALQLFKGQPCVYYLLNTYMPTTHYEEHYPWHTDIGDSIPRKSSYGLSRLADQLRRENEGQDYTFVPISALNTVVGEIKETLTKERVDFIVMGTQGVTAATDIIFGSNTTQVIKNVGCPVLAIPSGFKYRKPLNIVYPTDFKIAYSPQQMDPLLSLAGQFGSLIVVLHVISPAGLTEDQRNNRNLLEGVLQEIEHEVRSISGEHVPSVVSEYQENEDIDFLVMVQNKHTFFERLFTPATIKKIGLQIKVPFMVLPCLPKN